MADEATWVSGSVTVGFHMWLGDRRPEPISIYEFYDQDGPEPGGEDTRVAIRPRDITVIVWGKPDSDRLPANDPPSILKDGVHSKLAANRNNVGKLTMFDGFVVEKARLKTVKYLEPIGIGTSVGIPAFETVETTWKIES